MSNLIEVQSVNKTYQRGGETLTVLDDLSLEHKNKVYFIHMNHTNLMLDPSSELTKLVINKGFNITRLGLKLSL